MERWVETMTWFFQLGAKSWWAQESRPLSAEDAMNWDIFKHLFLARFIPQEYLDHKMDEFFEMRQDKMSASEYHQKFTDLSSYCPEIAENPKDMLRLFKKVTRKRLCSMATSTPCSIYQEFFEVLLRVKESENAPDDDDDDKEDNNNAHRNNNRGSLPLAL